MSPHTQTELVEFGQISVSLTTRKAAIEIKKVACHKRCVIDSTKSRKKVSFNIYDIRLVGVAKHNSRIEIERHKSFCFITDQT